MSYIPTPFRDSRDRKDSGSSKRKDDSRSRSRSRSRSPDRDDRNRWAIDSNLKQLWPAGIIERVLTPRLNSFEDPSIADRVSMLSSSVFFHDTCLIYILNLHRTHVASPISLILSLFPSYINFTLLHFTLLHSSLLFSTLLYFPLLTSPLTIQYHTTSPTTVLRGRNRSSSRSRSPSSDRDRDDDRKRSSAESRGRSDSRTEEDLKSKRTDKDGDSDTPEC